ncbi:MAG: hypothetical protein P1V36_08330 [Planctomycetota bacterium]|nr:hypothetical protein [Planctomycetota bacterium]
MGALKQIAVGLVFAAWALGIAGPAGAEDDPCLCRDMIVSCTATPRTVIVGDPFDFCATVKSVGAVPLENIRLTITGCPNAVVAPDQKLVITIPRLAQGESHTHCVRMQCKDVGECRLTAHATDATGIAASGCICSAFCKGLPALQLEMIDTAIDRSPAGIFRLGETFMYRLQIDNDVGSALTPDMIVRFSLPPELEFVRGRAEGDVTVSGSGLAATSSRFVLRPNQRLRMEFECKVVKVPPRALVAARVKIVADPSGFELAAESESTTLRR